ncbi:hypothetical protein AMECASPLE_023331 [Ameca splendens]|uniref:Uncharacterized protein n=1 Tax=Ameca splendens TaxID=208324 RepID=A0ABV0ZQS8_9TELE
MCLSRSIFASNLTSLTVPAEQKLPLSMTLPPPCSTMEIHDGSSRDIMGRLAVSLLSYLGGQDDGNPCIIVFPLHNYAPLRVHVSHNTLKYIEVCGCNVAIC